MFQPLRLFLVASEHQLGRSLSVISTGSSPFNSQMLDVSPTARSAKLQLVYGLKMSKTAALDTFTIQTFYMYMYCMYGGWLLSRGGECPPPTPSKWNPDSCMQLPDVICTCMHIAGAWVVKCNMRRGVLSCAPANCSGCFSLACALRANQAFI